ncbi:MAG: DUF2244 domain-containing protein [Paracoccaceae bacterium]|jgi:uncharacterized membrane protein|nr:DUF2244 domain-containing protein [Paracoccaceae bacterium]
MPYKWSQNEQSGGQAYLTIWPHSSLTRTGFAGFIAVTFGLIILPLFTLLGTIVLWGLLPFLLITISAVWVALSRSYHDRNILETLTVKQDDVHLMRRNPKGDQQEWDCNVYWAKLSIYATSGPVANYITLTGNGREVEIGAFLSEKERPTLYLELSNFLADLKKPPSQ